MVAQMWPPETLLSRSNSLEMSVSEVQQSWMVLVYWKWKLARRHSTQENHYYSTTYWQQPEQSTSGMKRSHQLPESCSPSSFEARQPPYGSACCEQSPRHSDGAQGVAVSGTSQARDNTGYYVQLRAFSSLVTICCISSGGPYLVLKYFAKSTL